MSFDIRVTFTVSFICAVFLESLTLQNHVIGDKEVQSVRDSLSSLRWPFFQMLMLVASYFLNVNYCNFCSDGAFTLHRNKMPKVVHGLQLLSFKKKNVLKNFLLDLFGHILTKNVVHLLQWYSSGNDKAKTTDGFCKMTEECLDVFFFCYTK